MTALFVLYLVSGTLLIGLSIPLIQRRVPPNPFYGFRVERTLSNPDVWYDANAYAGRGLLWVGLLTVATTLLFRLVPGIGTDAYAIGVSVLVIGGLLASTVASFRYLRSLD